MTGVESFHLQHFLKGLVTIFHLNKVNLLVINFFGNKFEIIFDNAKFK